MITDSDIFGDPQTEPDLSGEALNWEPDDTFEELRGDSLPSADEDADTNDDAEEAQSEEEQTDEVENDGEPVATEDDLPEAFRGKTAAELVKIIQDSQSFVAKQGGEIGELRKLVDEVRQRQSAPAPTQYAPPSDYIHDTQDGLIAYREGVQLLDQGQIGPEAIDEIIDVVREIDPATAAKMDRDFGMRLARAEMNVSMAPVMQQSYDIALQQATAQVNADPDAEAYREDIVRIVQNPQSLIEQQVAVAYQQSRTAPEIAATLQAALQVARGSNPTKAAGYRAALEQAKLNEQVESGNSAPAETPTSLEDQIRNSLLAPADPGAQMFAGFGGR